MHRICSRMYLEKKGKNEENMSINMNINAVPPAIPMRIGRYKPGNASSTPEIKRMVLDGSEGRPIIPSSCVRPGVISTITAGATNPAKNR